MSDNYRVPSSGPSPAAGGPPSTPGGGFVSSFGARPRSFRSTAGGSSSLAPPSLSTLPSGGSLGATLPATPGSSNSNSNSSSSLGLGLATPGSATTPASSLGAAGGSGASAFSFALSSASGPTAAPAPEYQLDAVDARRFMALLEEGKERLDLVGLMLVDPAKRRDGAAGGKPGAAGAGAGAGGSSHHTDIADLLQTQKQLEERYAALTQRRKELRGLSNRARAVDNEAEIQAVIALLRQSTSNVTVHLKDVPSLSGAFQKLVRDRDMVASAVELSIEELKQGSFQGLVEVINAHIERHRLLEESQKTLAVNLEKSQKLEVDIRLEEAAFKQSEETKNREIARLTQHLKHLRKVTTNQLRYEEDAARAQLESIRRVREQRLQDLEAEISRLQRDVATDALAHDKATAFLDMQRRELDALHQTWEHKAAADVAKREAMLEGLSELRAREKAKLNALAERWETEEEERLAQVEEIKRRTIETQAQQELAERMDRAQRLIRFWWRVYKRKLAKKRKNKKKKKSKKEPAPPPGSRLAAPAPRKDAPK